MQWRTPNPTSDVAYAEEEIESVFAGLAGFIVDLFVGLVKLAVAIVAAAMSFLWGIVKGIISGMINLVIETINTTIAGWGEGLVNILSLNFEANSPIKVIGDYLDVFNTVFDYLLLPFTIVATLVVIAQAVEVIAQVFTAGISNILSRVVQFAVPLFLFGIAGAAIGASIFLAKDGVGEKLIESLGDASGYITGYADTQEFYFLLAAGLLAGSVVVNSLVLGVMSIFVSLIPKGDIWWKNLMLDGLALFLAGAALYDYFTGPDDQLAKVITPMVSTVAGVVVFSSWIGISTTILYDIATYTIIPQGG